MTKVKFRIKHKTEGWTGTLEIDPYCSEGWSSSHSCGGTILFTIEQDSRKENGDYVEDPYIENLDELEILEIIKE